MIPEADRGARLRRERRWNSGDACTNCARTASLVQLRQARPPCPSPAIGIAAMANGSNFHHSSNFVNQVQHSIVAASGGPGWIKRWVQRLADPVRILQQGPGDELIGGRCHLCWQNLGEGPRRGTRDPEPVRLVGHLVAGRRPTPRIIAASPSWSRLSPCWSALMPSRCSRSNCESASTAIVSCKAS